MSEKILIVDDEPRVVQLVKRVLEAIKYQVIAASNGESGLEMVALEQPDLVLLDILLPHNLDGYEVCRRIREFSQVPIIIVTAKGKDEDKVCGLDIGADDYMTKPFSAKELAARVRAALRRAALLDNQTQPTFSCRGLVIDFTAHRVSSDGLDVQLTATEYKLLSYLVHNAGRVVVPDQILERVWGEEYIGNNHVLQVNVARLRQKLGDDARKPRYILTRPGTGYMVVKQTSLK